MHASSPLVGAPFMLCKIYSTCGSGVQPTAPGNDIHSAVWPPLFTQVSISLSATVTGHRSLRVP